MLPRNLQLSLWLGIFNDQQLLSICPFLDFFALKRKCKSKCKRVLVKNTNACHAWLLIVCKIDKEKNLYRKMYHETRVQPCFFWYFFQFFNDSKFSAPIISKRQRKNMSDGQIHLQNDTLEGLQFFFACLFIEEQAKPQGHAQKQPLSFVMIAISRVF